MLLELHERRILMQGVMLADHILEDPETDKAVDRIERLAQLMAYSDGADFLFLSKTWQRFQNRYPREAERIKRSLKKKIPA